MNPNSIDEIFGMGGYSWKGKGIGGRIKKSPDDFIVQEIPENSDLPLSIPPEKWDTAHSGGLYYSCRIWRKGIDHAQMIQLLTRYFKVPETSIGTSGIKDANATVVQCISIFNTKKRFDSPQFINKGLIADSFHYRRSRIYPGSHQGNHFTVRIQDANQLNEDEIEAFLFFIEAGIPNYYGYQRFGTTRPITAQVGRLVLNKKYKEAVDVFLGANPNNLQDKTTKFRKMWNETKDPQSVLDSGLMIPTIERKILNQLVKKPNNYSLAIHTLPEFIINISKSAFISLLANEYISQRGIEASPYRGERQVHRNIELALPSGRWNKPLNQIWQTVFSKFNVSLNELKSIKHTSRMLKLYARNTKGVLEDQSSIQLSFSLEPGCYATTILRELMKMPVNCYV